jgi:two-component system, chemotaxis family, chemotaxis protein CheY
MSSTHSDKRDEPQIWFVDDDRTFRFVVERHIQTMGIQDNVTFFDDGDRAMMRLVELKKSGARPPKLIFLDLQMKYLEGWQFLDLITEFSIGTKVVILTSSLLPQDRERAQQQPLVAAFLNKPVTLEDLQRTISELTT